MDLKVCDICGDVIRSEKEYYEIHISGGGEKDIRKEPLFQVILTSPKIIKHKEICACCKDTIIKFIDFKRTEFKKIEKDLENYVF